MFSSIPKNSNALAILIVIFCVACCIVACSWIDSFQTDQQWTLIMHITCWLEGGKTKRIQPCALHPGMHTGSNWQKPSTWIGLGYWLSRTNLPPQLRPYPTTTQQFSNPNLQNPIDTFHRCMDNLFYGFDWLREVQKESSMKKMMICIKFGHKFSNQI